MKRWLALLAIPSLAIGGGPSASAQPLSRTHAVQCVPPPLSPPGCDEKFDFQNASPADFLRFLRSAQSPFPVFGKHRNWIKGADIGPLLALVDSTESCALVAEAHLSYAPLERSNVGREALFLLQGLRAGVYPPAPYSKPLGGQERAELIAWAKKQSRAADSLHPPSVSEIEACHEDERPHGRGKEEADLGCDYLKKVLPVANQVSEYAWLNHAHHPSGIDRNGALTLSDGTRVRWMNRPGGLSYLEWPDGGRIYLVHRHRADASPAKPRE